MKISSEGAKYAAQIFFRICREIFGYIDTHVGCDADFPENRMIRARKILEIADFWMIQMKGILETPHLRLVQITPFSDEPDFGLSELSG